MCLLGTHRNFDAAVFLPTGGCRVSGSGQDFAHCTHAHAASAHFASCHQVVLHRLDVLLAQLLVVAFVATRVCEAHDAHLTCGVTLANGTGNLLQGGSGAGLNVRLTRIEKHFLVYAVNIVGVVAAHGHAETG